MPELTLPVNHIAVPPPPPPRPSALPPPEILRAVNHGWEIFPLQRGTKDGYYNTNYEEGGAGYSWQKQATNDLNRIMQWAVDLPGCNWGARTGHTSGFYVLDLDSPEAHQYVKDAGLEITYLVKTGRADGNGLQAYVRQPEGVRVRTASDILKGAPRGLDVRGDKNGYVVLPPSIHPDGPAYEILAEGELPEAPPSLLALVTDNRVEPPPVDISDLPELTADQKQIGINSFLKRCREYPQTPDGQWNTELNLLAGAAGRRIARGVFTEEWATEQIAEAAADYIADDRNGFRNTLKSGLKYGLQRPWEPEAAEDYLREKGERVANLTFQPRTPEEESRRREQILENMQIGNGVDMNDCPVASVLSLDYMLENFVKIMDGKRVVDMNRPRRIYGYDDWKSDLKASQTFKKVKGDPYFDAATGGLKSKAIDTLDIWNADKDGRKTVDTVTFRPGAKKVTNDPDGRSAVNIWMAPDRSKVTPGDPALFVQHTRYLFGEETEHFLDWLAHIEQKPGVLPHCGWVHVSPAFGTGRNWLASVLCRVWEGLTQPNFDLVETLRTGYNDSLSQKMLVIVDEINEGASKDKWANAEKLKSLVTADRRLINPKYGRQRMEFNCARWLIFSNHGTALPLTEGDRRFWVVRNDRPKKSPEYYSALYAAVNDAKFIAGVAQYLAQRDISSFNPGEHPKLTAAKREMVGASRTDVDDKIEELIASHPRDVITNSELGVLLGEQHFVGKLTSHHLNALERAGVRAYGKPMRIGGKLVKVRILRDFHYWKSAESDKIQAELSRGIGPEVAAVDDQSFAKFVARMYAERENDGLQVVHDEDLEDYLN